MDQNEHTTRSARQLWLVPREGQAGYQLVADVIVDAPTQRLYSYAVPDALADKVTCGTLLRVPYGRGDRVLRGVCARVSQQPWDHTRRAVQDVAPGWPWLSPVLVELALWVSDYYQCAPWKTLTAVAPTALRVPRPRQVRCVRRTAAPPPDSPTPRQAALLAALGEAELPRAELLARAGVGAGVLQTLLKGGCLEQLTRPQTAPSASPPEGAAVPPCPEDTYELTPDQQMTLARITTVLASHQAFRVFLLFGVPGSGKTEVYVRAIRQTIRAGRQAILLIPEIALATQIVARLARRFPRVAVLHSQLTAKRRRETLAAIAAGQVDVVIGTRTAVFAPCPRLGLLVVDEEQETSFKNLAAPFYHARDVAIKRGQLEQVPVLLGSATPALETWYNAHERPHYELLRLPERVPGACVPQTRLIPADEWLTAEGPPLLSRTLRAELTRTLAAGQQAILLHNRRGYAVYLRCTACGLLVTCTRCGGHMVLHQGADGAALKCHRCGRQAPVPSRCLDDTCGGRLHRSGLAIQRLEEELRRDFPAARLLRLDSDTMRRRDDYAAALEAFEAGAADILLGTQMVAKGLDFPRVRLVGVIEADAALALPDFRAAERVFQLIVQVVGRAGRREGQSLALVQTAAAEPPVIRHALALDYEAFAAAELPSRQRFFYPPVARLVRLICADARPERARATAERLAAGLQKQAGRIHAALRVDAPEPCVMPRLRELLRYQVLVRGPRDGSVQTLLQAAFGEKLLPPRVQRFTIDVDPVELL